MTRQGNRTMQALRFDQSSKAQLTNTTADPKDATKTVTFLCDLKGKPLASGALPVSVYRDDYTGDVYAQVAEVIPSKPGSEADAAAITALKPIHYCSADGRVHGYFVKVASFDDFTEVAA